MNKLNAQVLDAEEEQHGLVFVHVCTEQQSARSNPSLETWFLKAPLDNRVVNFLEPRDHVYFSPLKPTVGRQSTDGMIIVSGGMIK